MSKPQTTKVSLSERKRQAIIDAAIELFINHGVSSVSMDRISAHAEVSKRTVYKHFASKELLFNQIIQQLLEQSMQAIDGTFCSSTPLEAQLRRMLEQEMALLQSEGFQQTSRMVLGEIMQKPELAVVIQQQVAEAESGLQHWMEAAAQDPRTIDFDPSFVHCQMISQIKGFAFWPQFIGFEKNPDQVQQKKIIDATVKLFTSQYLINSN